MRLLALSAVPLVAIGCTTRVVVVWPDKPLDVRVTNCAVPAAATDGGAADDAAATVEPPPPSRAKLGATPVKLAADRGTLVFVEHVSANGGGNGLTVTEVAGVQGGACQAGAMKRIVWRVAAGGRWDAQFTVDAGKSLCAEATGGFADGEVVWTVR